MLEIITPPAVTPVACVGLSTIKQHLRVATDVTDEDDLITAYVAAAWALVERLAWSQLLTATCRVSVAGWRFPLVLPRPPIAEVSAVKYYDENGDLQTWDAANWEAVTCAGVVAIVPAYGVSAPSHQVRTDAVRVDYVAGYGITAASIPPTILHAVRLLVGQWYAAREMTAADESTVSALIGAAAFRDPTALELL